MKYVIIILGLILIQVSTDAYGQSFPRLPYTNQQSQPQSINNIFERVENYTKSNVPIRDSYGNLINGTVEGRVETGSIYDNSGYRVFTYHEYNFKNGVPHGEFKHTYSSNGRQVIVKGNYKDGKLDGRYEEFHINGQLKKVERYLDGIIIGESISYHDNGLLERKLNFVKGKVQDGPLIIYHSNGSISTKGYAKDGYWSGAKVSYYSNGNVQIKEFIHNGYGEG